MALFAFPVAIQKIVRIPLMEQNPQKVVVWNLDRIVFFLICSLVHRYRHVVDILLRIPGFPIFL